MRNMQQVNHQHVDEMQGAEQQDNHPDFAAQKFEEVFRIV